MTSPVDVDAGMLANDTYFAQGRKELALEMKKSASSATHSAREVRKSVALELEQNWLTSVRHAQE